MTASKKERARFSMTATSSNKLIIYFALVFSLTACTVQSSKSSLITLDSLQDMVLDFSVKALHVLIDPDSASPFSGPHLEVNCNSDKNRQDCCVATGTMDIDLPLQDFSDKIRDELLNAIKGELQKFEERMSREPLLPEDMDWLIQLNEKIAQKVLEEWFDQNPKLQAIFEPMVLTPEACQQILTDEISQHFPAAFKEYYQFMLPPTQIPLQIPSQQPIPWPTSHIVPGIPY